MNRGVAAAMLALVAGPVLSACGVSAGSATCRDFIEMSAGRRIEIVNDLYPGLTDSQAKNSAKAMYTSCTIPSQKDEMSSEKLKDMGNNM